MIRYQDSFLFIIFFVAMSGCQCGKADYPASGAYGDRYLHAENHRWIYLEVHDSGKRLCANYIESVLGVSDMTIDLGDDITQKLWINLGQRKNMTLAIIFDPDGLSSTADWIHSYVSAPDTLVQTDKTT